jgi:hypothetical protein
LNGFRRRPTGGKADKDVRDRRKPRPVGSRQGRLRPEGKVSPSAKEERATS